MKNLYTPELWFVTGSQHLYGSEVLKKVAAHAQLVASALDADTSVPVRIVCKPIVTTPEEIRKVCSDASASPACAGIITWMHTFSPAKMWISGLTQLTKPICHLHTQFNRDIPWDRIDMDFMNLNQSAHGGREYGHILTRLRIPREVIVGHWEDPVVRARLADWAAVAAGWQEMRNLKVVRFGDNMRYVAVTDGDKVEAERVFGVQVNTHAIGDLVEVVNDHTDAEVNALCTEYADSYTVVPELLKGGERHESLRDAARIELGIRSFLEEGGYGAFVDCFEDLHGLKQLPDIAAQRLMADGYGFGPEGDWKHAALVRVMKVMGAGKPGGTSLMEDYTYHFDPAGARCLGSHMLEICASLAAEKPRCEIHPLGIGGKDDPVRLVFDGQTGPAINASLIDMGNRFRLLVNVVESVALPEPMPKLPVARVLWDAKPDLQTAAQAWILAGGAHHTGFSLSVSAAQMESFAEMAGIECVLIDENTDLRALKQELRVGETYYGLRGL
ncbi:L-arabinose isomerase [Ruficoccus sp. ZRK36]|uniref:L-arabinose isomerase n=1 Tax=Ruficoccus sp. ZRK36 TaxID=2866311 RepID=UPI001C72E3E8|nr:L-arabinose isomerase [Ruficoccus sp. ZRK36]QYY34493.1 L-arabinose isomerase [Ruficoccus sp. ZRK36]